MNKKTKCERELRVLLDKKEHFSGSFEDKRLLSIQINATKNKLAYWVKKEEEGANKPKSEKELQKIRAINKKAAQKYRKKKMRRDPKAYREYLAQKQRECRARKKALKEQEQTNNKEEN